MTKIQKNIFRLPVALCAFAVKKKSFRELQIYLYLKAKCCGQIRLNPEIIKTTAADLGVTIKTIQNNIKKLKQKNWLGSDPNYGYMFVRGFKKIMEIEKLEGRQAGFLDIDNDLYSYKKFKAYAISLTLSSLQKSQQAQERDSRKQKVARAGSRAKHASKFCEISCSSYSQIFEVSTKTASIYKRLAHEFNFIEVKKNLKRVDIELSELKLFKKHSDNAHKIRVFEKEVFIQNIDLIHSLSEIRSVKRLSISVINVRKWKKK